MITTIAINNQDKILSMSMAWPAYSLFSRSANALAVLAQEKMTFGRTSRPAGLLRSIGPSMRQEASPIVLLNADHWREQVSSLTGYANALFSAVCRGFCDQACWACRVVDISYRRADLLSAGPHDVLPDYDRRQERGPRLPLRNVASQNRAVVMIASRSK